MDNAASVFLAAAQSDKTGTGTTRSSTLARESRTASAAASEVHARVERGAIESLIKICDKSDSGCAEASHLRSLMVRNGRQGSAAYKVLLGMTGKVTADSFMEEMRRTAAALAAANSSSNKTNRKRKKASSSAEDAGEEGLSSWDRALRLQNKARAAAGLPPIVHDVQPPSSAAEKRALELQNSARAAAGLPPLLELPSSAAKRLEGSSTIATRAPNANDEADGGYAEGLDIEAALHRQGASPAVVAALREAVKEREKARKALSKAKADEARLAEKLQRARERCVALNDEFQRADDRVSAFNPSDSTLRRKGTNLVEAAKWRRMYDQLLRYKEEHGHTNVTRGDGDGDDDGTDQLAKWVANQRAKYKRHQAQLNLLAGGPEGSSSSSSSPSSSSSTKKKSRRQPVPFDPERIRLLESIGFDWAPPPAEDKWNSRYQELLDYKREMGHCTLFKQDVRFGPLGYWCDAQRKTHREWIANGRSATGRLPTRTVKLTEERFKKLENLGFEWNPTRRKKRRGQEQTQASAPKEANV